jgi:tetratricopeptide (TPR) repeat protein
MGVANAEMLGAILRNVIQLMETAATRPGGANITIATENLNQYFQLKGTPASEFELTPEVREYLTQQFEGTRFTSDSFQTPGFAVPDARHIEDCLLYRSIATRVAGTGNPLDQVRRLFDWTIHNVQLIPEDSLIPTQVAEQGLEQVPMRPYDVLSRGLATEIPGSAWAERAWAFMVLCQQINVDVGLIGYEVADQEEPYIWACAALVDGVPYLFDTRTGLAIPGPDGQGVATFEEAATIPIVLDRLDLPGQGVDYPTHLDDLQSQITIAFNGGQRYLASRMKLLQRDLYGDFRLVIYRDPVEQREAFAKAFGDRLASADLWGLPLEVEDRLFTDPAFVRSAQIPNAMFDPQLPLLKARLLQLRGDFPEAIQQYVSFRLKEVIEIDGEPVRLHPAIHQALDVHASYFLALCQLEKGSIDQAEFLFGQTLRLAPPPEPGNVVSLYRFGAYANLGMLAELEGEYDLATYCYSRPNPTSQAFGNLYRARNLVWKQPFASKNPPEVPKESVGWDRVDSVGE